VSDTYTLYYSELQKISNKREFKGNRSSGSYLFLDQRTNMRYEVTEFIGDRYFFGVCFVGKPSWPDAVLVATKIPTTSLHHVQLTQP